MMGLGVGHSAAKEEAMSIKASEVSEWLRKSAGKRDHHELMPEDYVVVRPGPNVAVQAERHMRFGSEERTVCAADREESVTER